MRMPTARGVAALIGAALALAGCSTAQGDSSDQETIPVATEAPPSEDEAGTPSGGPTGQEETGEPVETSDVGDVEASLGTPVGLVDSEGTSQFSVTVDSIEFLDVCPSRLEDGTQHTPENGSFLVADVTASMEATYVDALDAGEEPFLTLDADAWYVTDLNGVAQQAPVTVSSYGCFSTDERMTPFINPGETLSGKIVLDVDITSGYLVYNPWGVEGSGWRWRF